MQEIRSHNLDVYPIVQHYIKTLGLFELFALNLPLVKGESSHSKVLCVTLSNIIINIKPLYKISEWLNNYTDGKGEYGYEASYYTDDRIGDALDALYEADRHSLMCSASSNAINLYELSTEEVHNDSTTISFAGNYDGFESGESIQPTRGYNKDHRPDAKQIIFSR